MISDLSVILGMICVISGVASDLYHKENVVAFVGPACAYSLEGVGRMAGYWNVPLVTGTYLAVWRVCQHGVGLYCSYSYRYLACLYSLSTRCCVGMFL